VGLFEEEKGTKPRELDDEEKIAIGEKEANRTVVIGSLILGFCVGLFVVKQERSALPPVMQAISQALGFSIAILIFAGIPSAIAAKFTTKWRYVWAVITFILLVSQIIVFFYEKK
jgi:hypothetical protein